MWVLLYDMMQNRYKSSLEGVGRVTILILSNTNGFGKKKESLKFELDYLSSWLAK